MKLVVSAVALLVLAVAANCAPAEREFLLHIESACGASLSVLVKPSDRIADVKRKVFELYGLPIDLQRLVLPDHVHHPARPAVQTSASVRRPVEQTTEEVVDIFDDTFEDDDNLFDLNINAASTIHMQANSVCL